MSNPSTPTSPPSFSFSSSSLPLASTPAAQPSQQQQRGSDPHQTTTRTEEMKAPTISAEQEQRDLEKETRRMRREDSWKNLTLHPELKAAIQNRELLHIKDGKRHLILGMIGLPARGKSYIAQKLARYLTWLGYKTKVFNLGQYRRNHIRADVPCSWFNPHNEAAMQMRSELLSKCLGDIGDFFSSGGQAAILDGTNSTAERREKVHTWLEESPFAGEIMWIESVCNDPEIIDSNIRATWLSSPDYAHMDSEAAIADFRRRIAFYETSYESVEDEEMTENTSYVRLINNGHKAETNGIRGYLPSRIVFFLMNLQITRRPIYFTRHGQSEWNVMGKLGGNPPLTASGAAYATNLGKYLRQEIAKQDTTIRIWCSTLERTIQTAGAVKEELEELACGSVTKWRALAEINAGVYDGCTYEQVQMMDPDGFEARARDKLNYKYPHGESYKDVIDRVERVIFEIERQEHPVLVVGHQAVLRCLYGYFADVDLKDIPNLPIPLHTVIKLTPMAYRCVEERIDLSKGPVESNSEDDHQAKESVAPSCPTPPVAPAAAVSVPAAASSVSIPSTPSSECHGLEPRVEAPSAAAAAAAIPVKSPV